MRPRIGALFAGYGGLDLATQDVYGGSLAWYSEIDKGALKILAHRFPGVPNHGDITTIDWSQVEPVDILTGGSPCQDLSHAGRRAGMTEGTRSNLWVAMREAIAQLRPSTVIWENVRGAYSAAADSAVEPCPGCVGDGPGVHLRALGRVLGDLADLGYDARWHGLRAADVGAPHGRFRVFVVATDAHGAGAGWDRRAVSSSLGEVGRENVHLPTAVDGGLLPTPSCSDTNGAGAHGDGGLDLRAAIAQRLPATPRAFGSRTSRHAATTAYRRSAPSLEQQIEIANGITPREIEGADVQDSWRATWGDYAAAIARWESVLRRPAPAPTMTSSKGNPQLSARFVEWLMGLPVGWVTDVPGITRNEALKALGNGVVPQQAAAALRFMASWEVAA